MSTQPRKCKCCNKKIPLTTFACRCGHLFCAMHNFSENHNCTFDYRAESILRLSTIMEKVVAKKVEVI